MSLTREEAFKIGFLLRCADEGLTPEETAQRIKQASMMNKEGQFPLPWAVSTAGKLIGLAGTSAATGIGSFIGSAPGRVLGAGAAVLPAAGITALALPALGGAGAGYLAAKSTSSDADDLEQAKQDEIEGEYYRLAQEARRNAARKKLQSRLGRKVTLISPSL
jgi:hypothetical protein